jgi:hypothetical protein
MPAARRYAPAKQLARPGEDFVGAGGQLMTIDAGDVGAVIGVLRDPPTVDQPDDGPTEI